MIQIDVDALDALSRIKPDRHQASASHLQLQEQLR